MRKIVSGKDFDENLIRRYWGRFKEYGATPEGSFWISKDRQSLRFKVIFYEIDKLLKSDFVEVADVGCGYGALVSYLKMSKSYGNISYTGYDINKKLIEECRKITNEDWAVFKIGSKPERQTMFTIMSGTYNLAATQNLSDWEDYVSDCLQNCWERTSQAMIFNLQISDRARISNENIYFAEKTSIIELCVSRFGPTKLIVHEGLPNDITFSVIKTTSSKGV